MLCRSSSHSMRWRYFQNNHSHLGSHSHLSVSPPRWGLANVPVRSEVRSRPFINNFQTYLFMSRIKNTEKSKRYLQSTYLPPNTSAQRKKWERTDSRGPHVLRLLLGLSEAVNGVSFTASQWILIVCSVYTGQYLPRKEGGGGGCPL